MENNLLTKQKRGLIALVMAGFMLAGCVAKVPGFDYETNSNGIVEVSGDIDYSVVSRLNFVRLVNKKSGYEGYFLAYEYHFAGGRGVPGRIEYVNVENDDVIYCATDEIFNNFEMEVLVEQLIDYLYKYNMVKGEYTIEDILYIKECLLSDDVLFPNVTASKPFGRVRILF